MIKKDVGFTLKVGRLRSEEEFERDEVRRGVRDPQNVSFRVNQSPGPVYSSLHSDSTDTTPHYWRHEDRTTVPTKGISAPLSARLSPREEIQYTTKSLMQRSILTDPIVLSDEDQDYGRRASQKWTPQKPYTPGRPSVRRKITVKPTPNS